jgi:hypothetical protein
MSTGYSEQTALGGSNVIRWLKAGIVEEEKTSTARKWLCKHISLAEAYTTVEERWEAVFSMWSTPRS